MKIIWICCTACVLLTYFFDRSKYSRWQLHTIWGHFGIFQAASKVSLFTGSPRSLLGQHQDPGWGLLWQFYLKIRQVRCRVGMECVGAARPRRIGGWGTWSRGAWSNRSQCGDPELARPCLDSPDLMTGISQVKKKTLKWTAAHSRACVYTKV